MDFSTNLYDFLTHFFLGKMRLPPQINPRYTLVLDLDETLVHCSVESIGQPDLTFPVTFNGFFYQVYVRKRPFLDFFLETVSRNFEVIFIIFYSGSKFTYFLMQ